MNFPTRSDIFGLGFVYDYNKGIGMSQDTHKVVTSKKKFNKKSNHKTKTTYKRMQNK